MLILVHVSYDLSKTDRLNIQESITVRYYN